eukprot:TRINITY_DN884_c0_g1_i1.p1 TRINITY_DN884_c0_g1~~TRINITY_DN884_c0_g1_i1.p1  ORF type:complete len:339 (-),score=106.89 TRINITY_DN884_c0_g1_i1:15-1031(-)
MEEETTESEENSKDLLHTKQRRETFSNILRRSWKSRFIVQVLLDLLMEQLERVFFEVVREETLGEFYGRLEDSKDMVREWADVTMHDDHGEKLQDLSELEAGVFMCDCCGRPVQAARFAPHLEKCMGLGRLSRKAARRSTMDDDSASSDGESKEKWNGTSASSRGRRSVPPSSTNASQGITMSSRVKRQRDEPDSGATAEAPMRRPVLHIPHVVKPRVSISSLPLMKSFGEWEDDLSDDSLEDDLESEWKEISTMVDELVAQAPLVAQEKAMKSDSLATARISPTKSEIETKPPSFAVSKSKDEEAPRMPLKSSIVNEDFGIAPLASKRKAGGRRWIR